MAEYGIIVTQEGVPVERAADYQKVLDSRWRFMEVEYEVDVTVTIPGKAASGTSYPQYGSVFKHNLSFIPAFHGSWEVLSFEYSGGSHPDLLGAELLISDKEIVLYRLVDSLTDVNPVTIRVKAIIYNLPIDEEYQAPAEASRGSGRAESDIGVRALDGSNSKINISDNSSYGFSIDTKKKVLSINKVGSKAINFWIFDDGRATAVNVSTDTFTIEDSPGGGGGIASSNGVEWMETGIGLTLFPPFVGGVQGDLPAPLSQNTTYYIIRTSPTTMKLALSKSNAEAGTAINITSSGDTPIQIQRAGTLDDSRIPHGSLYPPSFFFCEVDLNNLTERKVIRAGSLKHISTTPLVSADSNYLYFGGVQAVYANTIAYIILKDPLEIAQ